MGFFCYTCGKKVRGQPVNHGHTRKKYGKHANRRVYDQSGGGRHRIPKLFPPTVCFEWKDTGSCSWGERCKYAHKSNAFDPRKKRGKKAGKKGSKKAGKKEGKKAGKKGGKKKKNSDGKERQDEFCQPCNSQNDERGNGCARIEIGTRDLALKRVHSWTCTLNATDDTNGYFLEGIKRSSSFNSA